jgi:6-pyruvoyltetrahydropterin/6-carboxytetrahydropterin synthase
MYTLSTARRFIAQHYLIGGDWGAENELHSHAYKLEVRLSAEELDQHGYLIDLLDLEAALDHLILSFADRTLNDLPAFGDSNPSLERFARILTDELRGVLQAPALVSIEVRLWENETAWASYRAEF